MRTTEFKRKDNFPRNGEWYISFRVTKKTPHISFGLEQKSYKGHREFFEYFNRYELKYLEEFADNLNEAIRLMKDYIQK